MVFKALPYSLKLVLFISRLLLKLHKNHTKALKRTLSNTATATTTAHFKSQTPSSSLPPSHRLISTNTLFVFDVEATLFRSSSLFPYFMLVAFEAGSFFRAFLLFALYPLLCFLNEDASLNIMVMLAFFGIKQRGFRVGASVLPKFFLEDVGADGFNTVTSAKKKVGVTRLPRVMVECFLRDYMEVDYVFGSELVVFRGYFVGLIKKQNMKQRVNDLLLKDDDVNDVVACFSNKSSLIKHDHWISCSKEVYMVSNGEKWGWQILPRQRYPKALTFHDGRLAFRPDPQSMLVMFMWFPFAVCLSIFRTIIAISMPYDVLIPVLSFTGMHLKLTNPNPDPKQHKGKGKGKGKAKGRLYVCNHRTLLDPLYLSFGLKKPFAAVTYSLSRMSEVLSPIKTVRLTRDREEDSKMMEKMLKQGDLVVCPEGTTCREPYLLRFSPLFAELSDHIVPVALDTHVSMFYGTTASGLKCLDPFMFMMNPRPAYRVWFLEEVSGGGGSESIQVANDVQREIGKTLEFECTRLTRKDKYLVLAGNEGLVSKPSSSS